MKWQKNSDKVKKTIESLVVLILLSSMKSILSPTTEQSHRLAALGVLLLLAVSALSLLAAMNTNLEQNSQLDRKLKREMANAFDII